MKGENSWSYDQRILPNHYPWDTLKSLIIPDISGPDTIQRNSWVAPQSPLAILLFYSCAWSTGSKENALLVSEVSILGAAQKGRGL